jgi:hypothetical protein
MPYVVRKGSLQYRPTVGNGPCARRHVGKPSRRIIQSFVRDGVEYRPHATKGWRRSRVEG